MTPTEALRQQIEDLFEEAMQAVHDHYEPTDYPEFGEAASDYAAALLAILALQAEAARPAGEDRSDPLIDLAETMEGQARASQINVEHENSGSRKQWRAMGEVDAYMHAAKIIRHNAEIAALPPPSEPASRWEDVADAFAAEPGSRFAQQAPPMTFQHGRHSWCQPRDEPRRHFFLRFADSDMGEQVFNGENAEAEAWAAWDKYAPAWNCYLIAVLAQHDRPAPTPGALADGGEIDQGSSGELESAPTGVASQLLGGDRPTDAVLEAMARAHDREDAAQRGEPDPWAWTPGEGDPVLQDFETFRADRVAAMREACTALMAGPVKSPDPASLWQPIETAPSDGTTIIIVGGTGAGLGKGEVRIAQADGDWWRTNPEGLRMPTHWQPLPLPPSPAKQAPEAPPVTAEADTPHVKKPSPLPVSEALTDEVVERMARALFEERYRQAYEGHEWHELNDVYQGGWIAAMRAALDTAP
jgi:hypothetical protein